MALTSRLRTDRVIDKTRGANFLGSAQSLDWFIVLERDGSRIDFGPGLGHTLERLWVRWARLIAAGSLPYEGPSPETLFEKAESVEESGQFEAAIKLYGDLEEAALAWGDDEALIRTLLNTGRTRRKLGDWDEAKTAYDMAGRLTSETGMLGLGARALLGTANVHRLKGNHPLARETYEASLAQASEAGDAHCVGLCEHGLSYMELSTGDAGVGIVRAWSAYRAYPEQRDRILALTLTGTGWLKLGHLSTARSAYEIVAHIAEPGDVKTLALDALGLVAAHAGDEVGFRVAAARADRQTIPLSANARGQILYHRGESLLRLGHIEEARLALDTAMDFLAEHKLGVLMHKVEQMAASLDPEPTPETVTLASATRQVGEELEVERSLLVTA